MLRFGFVLSKGLPEQVGAREPDSTASSRGPAAGIARCLELTGTFKLRKQEPLAEGYDRTRITDPLYFDDRQAYVRLDDELYARVQQGTLRL